MYTIKCRVVHSSNTIKLPNHNEDPIFQCCLHSDYSLCKIHTITRTLTIILNCFFSSHICPQARSKLNLFKTYYFCFCMTRRLCLSTILECPFLEVRLMLDSSTLISTFIIIFCSPHIITLLAYFLSLYAYLPLFYSSTNT